MNRRMFLYLGFLSTLGLGSCQRQTSGPVPASGGSSASITSQAPTLSADALARLRLRELHVGRYADDTGLWQDPWVQSRLKALLGPKYDTFFGCLEVKLPTGYRDGVLYVTGSNAKDRTYAAVFALELVTGKMYVRLRERGRDSDFPSSGPGFVLPPAVRTYEEGWLLWPESRELRQGRPRVPYSSMAAAPAVPAALSQGVRPALAPVKSK